MSIIAAVVALAPYYNVFPIPRRFDYEPPSSTRMVVNRVSPFEIIWKCGLAYACTKGTAAGGGCVFYFPKGKAAYYWRHERAHCNGWPPNHPYP